MLKRARVSALVTAAIAALLVPLGARAASRPPIVLAKGAAAFWSGGYVEDANTHLPGAAACSVIKCFEFPLKVAAGGWRLRVALDTPARYTQFELDLLDPHGTQVASVNNPAGSEFDIEAFALHPAAGTWTARVVPQETRNASFRMRAKLETGPLAYPKKTMLLPDLMVTPPYEFTFVAPANPGNAFATDDVNPPLEVAGEHPFSCTPDEMVNDHVSRCLRFTTGPRDAGPGALEIAYDPTAAKLGLSTPGPAFQRVYYSDGTSFLRPAGQFQFHPVHGHYHYLNFLTWQLYHVSSSYELTKAGGGKKLGLCPADELFADWTVFNQEQSKTFTPNCGLSAGEANLGLNVGWGDVYRWQRPGQYADFTGDGDGYYLLRVTVNAGHQVLEPNYANDDAYAYIHIVGDNITLIERGQGSSPWDPNRVVFTNE